MEQCEFHISVSRQVMEAWRQYPALDAKQWFCIPNCSREEAAEKLLAQDREQIRATLGWPVDGFMVVCVASLQKRKGQDILISLMDDLIRHIPQFHLVLVGPISGKEAGGEEIVNQARRSASAGRIHITGQRTDALECIYAADCFILPSREEALPRALMEAMILKTPAIASNVNGIPELIDDGVSGLLFSHHRPEELVEKVTCIVKDKQFGENLAYNASRKYWEYFSREHHMRRWRDALKCMLPTN